MISRSCLMVINRHNSRLIRFYSYGENENEIESQNHYSVSSFLAYERSVKPCSAINYQTETLLRI